MISYDDIRELQQYRSKADSLVLSLYLDVDQSKVSNLNRRFETAVENLFRRLRKPDGERNGASPAFTAPLERVSSFLSSYVPRSKNLVIFCDSTGDLWWQRELQIQLPTEARLSQKPWLRPLLEVLDDASRFAAVLIDKHRARILSVDETGLRREAELISDVPGKHVTTGTDHLWSQAQMQRDHDNHLKAHAKRAGEEVGKVIDRLKVKRFVIGGPVEATTIFASQLPRRLQGMIAGTVSVPVETSDDRLLASLKAAQQKSDDQDETRMVESMITAAKKGDRAVLGVEDTLSAIQQGRVHRMVVASDYHAVGKECGSCHLLATEEQECCPLCGAEFESAPDLINRASHRVIEQAGQVHLVSGDAADKLADAGVGAFLRF
jgi:peptide subunit release factor 1 (eRF1)